MYKYLFFDDDRLLKRQNVKRKYGTPQLQTDAIYTDGVTTTPWPGPWVFKLDDGSYRMLYQGLGEGSEKELYCARSKDGVHFQPENVSALTKNKLDLSHAIMVIPNFDEVGYIVEDKINNPNERYKMLYVVVDLENYTIRNRLLVSPDLIVWKELPDISWGAKGEPLIGVFYNEKKGCFTLIIRPNWMKRMVGIVETKDWRTFTQFELCLRADSIDGALDEIYGMPSYSYEGRFIGMPHVYSGFPQALNTKCTGGSVKIQLSYSWDGHHWQRSLRDPFISGVLPDSTAKAGFEAPVIFACNMIQGNDGSHLIYAHASSLEHGPCFHANSKDLIGKTYIYRLRKDGFIRLVTENNLKESLVATRENLWNGEDLHINLKTKKATLAVYCVDNSYKINTDGICKVVDGMDHDDCIPFTGDTTDWIPKFKTAKTLANLKGQCLTFEIKFSDGELYSISGDMIPLFSVEGDHYRRFGILPDTIY